MTPQQAWQACPQCRVRFTVYAHPQTYCSSACRQAAYRGRIARAAATKCSPARLALLRYLAGTDAPRGASTDRPISPFVVASAESAGLIQRTGPHRHRITAVGRTVLARYPASTEAAQ